MKKGMWGVGVLALVMITGLSVFYRAQVGKKMEKDQQYYQKAFEVTGQFCANREKADSLYL